MYNLKQVIWQQKKATLSPFKKKKKKKKEKEKKKNSNGFLFLVLFFCFLAINSRISRSKIFRFDDNDSAATKSSETTESSTTKNKSDVEIQNGGKFEKRVGIHPEGLWNAALSTVSPGTKTKKVAMEIGMHRIKSCLEAANAGFESHCFEPSPGSFKRINQQFKELPDETKSLIHLYNVAVGESSGGMVEFSGYGGTGDHVGGDANVWTMEIQNTTGASAYKNKNLIQVPTASLDDIISKHIASDREIFVVKIDTQGFEPSVFAGLKNSIRSRKIKIILFEYWPKGMDFLASVAAKKSLEEDREKRCQKTVGILNMLHDAGYKLYAAPFEVHPHAKSRDKMNKEQFKNLPLGDFMENCLFYYKLEESIYPQEDYKMGYWGDVMAVSGDTSLPSVFNCGNTTMPYQFKKEICLF